MSVQRLKAGVLISGTGSNLKALLDAIAGGSLELDITRVVSNRPEAPGIQHALASGVPVSVLSHKDFPDRESHDTAIIEALDADGVELVILAGYMRILSKDFTDHYANRMINLHPSLLPRHKGLDTYNRALEAGDMETGASIHFVTHGLDSGPVIAQQKIPIGPGDDADSLKATLGPLEHKLLVATVRLFCQRDIECKQGKVYYRGQAIKAPLLLQPSGTFDH
jgi:phosphoribosylglycinamide formyltransferase-1